MTVNNNFVIRNIFDTVILFPIKRNRLSNDPIYINNVVYQILKNAPGVSSKEELCMVITELFNLTTEENINEVLDCIDELIKIELIKEVNEDEQ